MFLRYFLIALIFSLEAHAQFKSPSGYDRGNGGMTLECTSTSKRGKGSFSLDRVEGETTYNFIPALSLVSANDRNFDENLMVNQVLENLTAINPSRAKKYQQWFQELLAKRIFVDDLNINPVNDGDFILVPEGCSLHQGAIFISDAQQKSTQFLFNKSTWKQMSSLDKTYLLLHELIYREARLPENNHPNSRPSRYLNAWLLSHLDSLTVTGWLEQLVQVGFRQMDYAGVSLQLTHIFAAGALPIPAPVQFYPNSKNIRRAVLAPQFSMLIDGELFEHNCYAPVQTAFTDYAEFYPTGTLKSITFLPRQFTINDYCESFHGFNHIEWSPKGQVIEKSKKEPPRFYNFDQFN